MGLSAAEKDGCKLILYQLSAPDLLSLYQTVTQIKPQHLNKKGEGILKPDLITRILEESKTAEELLNRKKVYRNILMQYLNNQHIFVLAKSTKHEAIQKLLEYWGKQDSSVTMVSKPAAKSPAARSLQLRKAVSDIDPLCVQITSLSINTNQEDSNKVDQAELGAQVHQDDPGDEASPKSRAKATSASKNTPWKSTTVPCAAEHAASKSSVTNESADSNTYTLLHISKPKRKTITTTVSVTISVSEETTDKRPQALKGTSTKKH